MKTVVITGVTKGLGLALARYFAAEGWLICGCGRNLKDIQDLSAELRAPHSITRVDVADEPSVRRWATGWLESHTAPDLLINNAAVIARVAPVWELSASEADAVINVNIRGVIHVLRHFVPAMVRRGEGVIANISSGWGRSTSPGVALYCASKWAIEGLTEALAQELPKGLGAVSVNPGIIRTDMLQTCFGEAASGYPSPEQWITTAGPFFRDLRPSDNGKKLTVPGARVS